MSDRSWILYGTHKAEDDFKGESLNVVNIYSTRRQVKMCGVAEANIHEYSFKETANGEYLGWLKIGADVVSNVRPANIFNIQFPYGAEKLVENGQGEIVRLTPVLVKLGEV